MSTLVELRRNPVTGMRTIRSTQRVGEDLREMVLRFDGDSRRVSVDGTRQQFEVQSLRSMICAALSDREMTEEQIFRVVEHGKTGAKRTALRSLCQDRSVERSGGGKKGDPYLYKKTRSHVPASTANRGNENSSEQTSPLEKILVPSTSFLYGNEETRIHGVDDVRVKSAEMLVPEKFESRLDR